MRLWVIQKVEEARRTATGDREGRTSAGRETNQDEKGLRMCRGMFFLRMFFVPGTRVLVYHPKRVETCRNVRGTEVCRNVPPGEHFGTLLAHFVRPFAGEGAPFTS